MYFNMHLMARWFSLLRDICQHGQPRVCMLYDILLDANVLVHEGTIIKHHNESVYL